MKTVNLKNGIIAGLLLIIISLSLFTCQQKTPQTVDNPFSPNDTVLFHYLRVEKANKQNFIKDLEAKVTQLQTQNKSLVSDVKISKQQLKFYRTKEFLLSNQLHFSLTNYAQKDTFIKDSIVPLLNQLTVSRDSSNKECDTTIAKLEQSLGNRDSVLVLQKQIELQLRDFNKEQALHNEYLAAQLNTTYKQQKKKTRQNKILAGGLLILSGITTSILLIHSQR